LSHAAELGDVSAGEPLLRRILVGVDGSENGAAAVDWASRLAALVGAEVVAVHAMGLLEPLAAGDAVLSYPHRDEIRERFEREWCRPLEAAPVPTTRVLHNGNAVTVLLAVADEYDVDLIVVGSRGLGGYPELLLGSTSTQVAQHSHRPVTIVPVPPA
jgi:nucleotide-binding universal stress UspA family protein